MLFFSFKDKRQLEEMEERLNQMRANNTTKRDIAIAVSCQGFYKTGLMTDIVQVTSFYHVSCADKS